MRTKLRFAYLLSAASLATAMVLPATATASGSLKSSTLPSVRSVAPLQAPASVHASPAIARNNEYAPCVTFIDEPCYASWIQGHGQASAIFTYYWEGHYGAIIVRPYCGASSCVESYEGFPGSGGDAISWDVSGPNIRSLEVF